MKTITLLATIIFIVGCGNTSKTTDINTTSSYIDICRNKDIAYKESHEFIKAFLKSPSSAKFRKEPTDYTYKGNCKHWVLSYVDSQNGFGAMLRKNYTIGVRYDENKSDWVLDEYPEFW